MIPKILTVFALLAFSVASAATYRVTLFQPAVVQGQELKPGDYRLEVKDTKVVLTRARQSVETAVKVESAEKKFASTTVRYANTDGRSSIQEIRLGGTTTRLVFNP
jgi:hypothetical protein